MASLSYEYWFKVLNKNGKNLKNLDYKYQTYVLCLIAVQQDGFALQFVKPEFKTYELCLAAVHQNGYSILIVPDSILEVYPELNNFAKRQMEWMQNERPKVVYKNDDRPLFRQYPEAIVDLLGIERSKFLFRI